MATVQALRKDTTPPSRSPERDKLAREIQDYADLTSQLNRIKAALERTSNASAAAYAAVKRGAAAVEEARAHEGIHLVAAALGEADASADPLKAAQEALRKAEADHQTAKRTSDALEAEAADVERRLQWARIGVNDAARAVLKVAPEVQRLLADLKVAQRTVDEIAGKLSSVAAVLPPSWTYYVMQPDDRAAASWSAAVEALHRDADATLPQS